MTAQVLDGSVAVLWGSAAKEVNWIHLSPKNGRVSIARAHADGFWVRDIPGVDGIERISREARDAWMRLRDGEDLPGMATHRLAPPQMQIVEPIPMVQSSAGQLPGQTELEL